MIQILLHLKQLLMVCWGLRNSDFLVFDSHKEYKEYLQDPNYDTSELPPIAIGIVFNEVDYSGETLNYTINLGVTGDSDEDGNLIFPKGINSEESNLKKNWIGYQFSSTQTSFALYRQHMMWFQDVVETWFIEESTNTTLPPRLIASQPFPYAAHKKDTFAAQVGSFLGIIFTLIFIFPITKMIKSIVEAKELKIDEAMKVMGLKVRYNHTARYVYYVFQFSLSTAFILLFSAGSMYPLSGKGYVFAFFLLFFLATLSFCHFISAFFVRARIASTIGGIAYLFAFFPYFSAQTMESMKLLTLFPPVTLSIGITVISTFESDQAGLTGANFGFEDTMPSMAFLFNRLLLQIVGYFLLSLYIEQVWPKKFGVPKHPLFFLFPSTYSGLCGWQSDEDVAGKIENFLRQDIDHGLDEWAFQKSPETEPDYLVENVSKTPSIHARFLNKKFHVDGREIHAVKDLNLDIQAGKIFCLLGHNGCGKSTFINTITGVYPPDSGNALVWNEFITDNMSSIRNKFGVCFQHDVLFDNLTVHEHFEMYARIKGVPRTEVQDQVTTIIQKMGLVEKTNELSKNLSGGMKRKLSVGISLIGNSTILFLDEPTAGMDPYSRRSLWDLLKKEKEKRCIILTTHFMDEADYLGDNIAIMRAGEIECVGTSLFLKKAFGTGYNLAIQKSNSQSFRDQEFLEFVQSKLHLADKPVVASNVAGELSIKLRFESAKFFHELFAALEKRKEEFGVESYAISVTKLDEVFMNVTRDGVEPYRPLTASQPLHVHSEEPEEMKDVLPLDHGDGEFEKLFVDVSMSVDAGFALFSRHFFALLRKRWNNDKRDLKVWAFMAVIPIFLFTVGCFFTSANISYQFRSMPLTYADKRLFKTENFTFPFALQNSTVFPNVNYNLSYLYSAETEFGLTVEPVPNPYTLQSETLRDFSTLSNFDLDTDNTTNIAYYLLETGWIHDDTNDYRLYTAERSRYGGFSVNSPDNKNVSLDPFIMMTQPLSIGQPYVDLTLFFNFTANTALPIVFNIANNVRFRTVSGNSDSTIYANYQPMPLTYESQQGQSTFISIILSNVMAFIAGNWIAFVVQERSSKMKHLQLISGVSRISYWLSLFVYDFIIYLVSCGIFVALLHAFDIFTYIDENLSDTIWMFILHGLAGIPFTYFLSFMFSNKSTAQNFIIMLNIICGIFLVVASVILAIIESTREIGDNLQYLFNLFPPYTFADATMTLAFGGTFITSELHSVNKSLTRMGIQAVVYTFLIMLLEIPVVENHLQSVWYRATACFRSQKYDNVVPDGKKNADIAEEEDKISKKNYDLEKDLVVIDGLRKQYAKNGKIAVRDMKFSVKQGEVFGFLGINGAGKTTTLKMLTGDIQPTSGTAFIKGYDIISQQSSVRQVIGYCPQFDAFLPNLTGAQILEFFSELKGIKRELIKTFVQRLGNHLGLQKYLHVPSGTYSGGNKRKLSVGIALAGNPPVVFLDEPSTGMDVASKRSMWGLISKTMKSRAVVLTTHSMEEAESLSNKIGIMVDGELKCIGSTTQLKSRYGIGMQLDVVLDSENAFEPLLDVLPLFFGDVLVLEKHLTNVSFKLHNSELTYEYAFFIVERIRQTFGIIEYSLSDVSLDQIFISFAKKQNYEQASHESEEEKYSNVVYKHGENNSVNAADLALFDNMPGFAWFAKQVSLEKFINLSAKITTILRHIDVPNSIEVVVNKATVLEMTEINES